MHSYTDFHPWLSDKTESRQKHMIQGLGWIGWRRFPAESHQEDRDTALVHHPAGNESMINT